MTVDLPPNPRPEVRAHGPHIGARHAAPLAILLWLVLVLGILWRV